MADNGAAAQAVNVEDLIAERPFGGFALRVMILAFIALMADGYDIQVMSFAAPSLVREWGLNRAALAPAFSASLFGILIGAPVMGFLGDRIGRRRAIIAGSAFYGVFCLLCLTATSLPQLMALRFLTGLGLGGVMPNVIALTAELTPRKVRAGLTTLVMVGVTAGGVVPGLIAANIPSDGAWRDLFLMGGIAPLVIAALMALGLPESASFLARRKDGQARLFHLAHAVDRKLARTTDADFVVHAPPTRGEAGIGPLFAGRLALVTPLLWLMFASTLLTIYLVSSWLPTLLEAGGFSPAKAAAANSLFQLGGVLGVIASSLLLGRFGARLVVALFALTLVAVAVTARAHLAETGLAAAVFAVGFTLIATQAALNGTAGLAYPTAARAKGVGMALGVGRIGSVIGPLLGGAMVAGGITNARDLFLLPLVPLALGALAAAFVMKRIVLDGAR